MPFGNNRCANSELRAKKSATGGKIGRFEDTTLGLRLSAQAVQGRKKVRGQDRGPCFSLNN